MGCDGPINRRWALITCPPDRIARPLRMVRYDSSWKLLVFLFALVDEVEHVCSKLDGWIELEDEFGHVA